MTPSQIYRIILASRVMISQQDFVNYFNESQREINNLFGDKFTLNEGSSLYDITDPKDGSNIRDEYTIAIAERIKHLATGEEQYDTRFGDVAQAAYLAVWRNMSKDKRVKKNEWGARNVR